LQDEAKDKLKGGDKDGVNDILAKKKKYIELIKAFE